LTAKISSSDWYRNPGRLERHDFIYRTGRKTGSSPCLEECIAECNLRKSVCIDFLILIAEETFNFVAIDAEFHRRILVQGGSDQIPPAVKHNPDRIGVGKSVWHSWGRLRRKPYPNHHRIIILRSAFDFWLIRIQIEGIAGIFDGGANLPPNFSGAIEYDVFPGKFLIDPIHLTLPRAQFYHISFALPYHGTSIMVSQACYRLLLCH